MRLDGLYGLNQPLQQGSVGQEFELPEPDLIPAELFRDRQWRAGMVHEGQLLQRPVAVGGHDPLGHEGLEEAGLGET